MRARLLGTRVGSGAPAEIFLLSPLGGDRYEAMVSPGGKLKPGRAWRSRRASPSRSCRVTERRTRIVQLARRASSVEQAIERTGTSRCRRTSTRADEAADVERYQTVYAREAGSVAAPTAGLHFTPELLAALAARGVQRAEVVLHVGAGTFKPVEVEDPAEHVMHEEWYAVPEDDRRRARSRARARGGRVWAVGTTTRAHARERGRRRRATCARAAARRASSSVRRRSSAPSTRSSPTSTCRAPRCIMLVAAFAGYDLTMRAYREAIAERYRFYSYGDAMAIV